VVLRARARFSTSVFFLFFLFRSLPFFRTLGDGRESVVPDHGPTNLWSFGLTWPKSLADFSLPDDFHDAEFLLESFSSSCTRTGREVLDLSAVNHNSSSGRL